MYGCVYVIAEENVSNSEYKKNLLNVISVVIRKRWKFYYVSLHLQNF